MNPKLVLDTRRTGSVGRAKRTVVRDVALGDKKQRDSPASRWRIWQPREHEMDDVVRHIVIAPGDEDLLSGDGVTALTVRLDPCPQRAEIGTGLRLGQIHRAGPLTGDQLGQIELLL